MTTPDILTEFKQKGNSYKGLLPRVMREWSMSKEKCIKIEVGTTSYDTLDRLVIPVTITNKCDESVEVELQLRDEKGRVLLESELLTLRSGERKTYEFISDFYGINEVTGRWRFKGSSKWKPLKTLALKT